ncbi:hypothetical protein DIURU_004356 [Diutina rugosa]|uniref:GST N-terminal domain-containing protein n=1 Tax=Diutina rugosa TaxID=5481 RepID=A0A642UI22_DIURU|nr:uncharacterized protein DIURU_004356 [Diutina rugosa]KAA8899334.1 hypothetical protein DIURU_004356 [Diutina rugosa]
MANLEKLIIHWVPSTRGARIIWLAIELGLPYEVKQTVKSAPYLKEIHPYGKIPLAEVKYSDGRTVVLEESGHIISYLLRHFDTDKKLSGKTPEEFEEVDFHLHWSEGSLIAEILPLFINKAHKWADSELTTNVFSPHAEEAINYLETVLAKQAAQGNKYIVGDHLTAADIINHLPVAIYVGAKLGPAGPNVQKWLKQIESEKSFQESHKNEGTPPWAS